MTFSLCLCISSVSATSPIVLLLHLVMSSFSSCYSQERLSHYKAPAYVLYTQNGEDFPRTANTKVQKYRLREMAVRALGLSNVKPHMEHEVNAQQLSGAPRV